MTKKLIKLMAIVLVVVLSLAVVSFAGDSTMSFDSISSGSFTKGAQDSTGTAGAVNRIMQAILTITQVIGVGVAVIMLIVLAIKYISAAPGDKADIKKHAVVYVVGAVVLFAASGILEIIKRFANMVNV